MKKFFKVVLVILLVAAIGFGISTIFWLPKIISDKKEAERLDEIKPWSFEDLPSYNSETDKDKTDTGNVDSSNDEQFDYIIKNYSDASPFRYPYNNSDYTAMKGKKCKVIGEFSLDLDFSARLSGGDFGYFPAILLANRSETSSVSFAQGFLLDMYGEGIISYTREEFEKRFYNTGMVYIEVCGISDYYETNYAHKPMLRDITIEPLSEDDERVIEMLNYMSGKDYSRYNIAEDMSEMSDEEILSEVNKLKKNINSVDETIKTLYEGKTIKIRGTIGNDRFAESVYNRGIPVLYYFDKDYNRRELMHITLGDELKEYKDEYVATSEPIKLTDTSTGETFYVRTYDVIRDPEWQSFLDVMWETEVIVEGTLAFYDPYPGTEISQLKPYLKNITITVVGPSKYGSMWVNKYHREWYEPTGYITDELIEKFINQKQ